MLYNLLNRAVKNVILWPRKIVGFGAS